MANNKIRFFNAIAAINPTAVYKGTLEDLEWLEGTTPISVDDIKTKMAELQEAEDTKEAQQEVDKASGNQKLKDLGLTDDEITAVTKG